MCLTHSDSRLKAASFPQPLSCGALPDPLGESLCWVFPDLWPRGSSCPLSVFGLWALPAESAQASEGARVHVIAVPSWGTARPCHQLPVADPSSTAFLPTLAAPKPRLGGILAHHSRDPMIISALCSKPRDSWVETVQGEVSGSGHWSARDQHGVGTVSIWLPWGKNLAPEGQGASHLLGEGPPTSFSSQTPEGRAPGQGPLRGFLLL